MSSAPDRRYDVELRFPDGQASFFRMGGASMSEALTDLARRCSASLSRVVVVKVRVAE